MNDYECMGCAITFPSKALEPNCPECGSFTDVWILDTEFYDSLREDAFLDSYWESQYE